MLPIAVSSYTRGPPTGFALITAPTAAEVAAPMSPAPAEKAPARNRSSSAAALTGPGGAPTSTPAASADIRRCFRRRVLYSSAAAASAFAVGPLDRRYALFPVMAAKVAEASSVAPSRRTPAVTCRRRNLRARARRLRSSTRCCRSATLSLRRFRRSSAFARAAASAAAARSRRSRSASSAPTRATNRSSLSIPSPYPSSSTSLCSSI